MTGPDWVIHVGEGAAADDADLGALGRALAASGRAGLDVVPAFGLKRALRDEAARLGELPPDLDAALDAAVARLERATVTRRDDPALPLLVDVYPDAEGGRAAGFSRLGLAPTCLAGVVARTGDPVRADRELRDLVADLGTRVYGVPRDVFEDPAVVDSGSALLRFELYVGAPFPATLDRQLRLVVGVLLDSQRLRLVHRLGQVDDEPRGEGLLVSASLFGAAGAESGAGSVIRSGRTGVGGVRFRPDEEELGHAPTLDEEGTRRLAPRVAVQLEAVRVLLSQHAELPSGLDFIAEAGRLFVVGVARDSALRDSEAPELRVERSPAALPEHAPDELTPGEVAIERESAPIAEAPIDSVATPALEAEPDLELELDVAPPPEPRPAAELFDDAVVAPIVTGDGVAPGVASGRLVFDSETALHCHRAGLPVILVRAAEDDGDLGGLAVSRALLVIGAVLAAGGVYASRAIRVAVRMGLPTLALPHGVVLDPRAACLRADGQLLREGDPVTVDAAAGRLFLGSLAVPDPHESEP